MVVTRSLRLTYDDRGRDVGRTWPGRAGVGVRERRSRLDRRRRRRRRVACINERATKREFTKHAVDTAASDTRHNDCNNLTQSVDDLHASDIGNTTQPRYYARRLRCAGALSNAAVCSSVCSSPLAQ